MLRTADLQTLAVVVLPRRRNRTTPTGAPPSLSALMRADEMTGDQNALEVTPERIAARPGPPVPYKATTQGQKARR